MGGTEPYVQWWTLNTPTVNGSTDWNDRGIIFGPNGGTAIWNTAPPMSGPKSTWFGFGGTGTVVVGEPLPYSGDPWETNAITGEYPGLDRIRSPFEVEYGLSGEAGRPD